MSVTPAEIQKARLLALILPAAEREELRRKYGVRPAALSGVIGIFEFLLGVVVYYLGSAPFGGALGWVLWHLNPVTWLGLLIMSTGIFRIANWLANNDSFGEPLVWLYLRLYQGKRAVARKRRIREEFGPDRPDRVILDADGGLVLLASREKPDWDEYRTVRIEDDFFKIESVEERRDGRYKLFAYVLEEVPESEVLRGIVHTDAKLPRPAGRAARAATPSTERTDPES